MLIFSGEITIFYGWELHLGTAHVFVMLYGTPAEYAQAEQEANKAAFEMLM